MRIYEHFGDRLDLRGLVLRRGETIELEESDAAELIASDIPIRPAKADEPATPVEVKV